CRAPARGPRWGRSQTEVVLHADRGRVLELRGRRSNALTNDICGCPSSAIASSPEEPTRLWRTRGLTRLGNEQSIPSARARARERRANVSPRAALGPLRACRPW